MFPFFYHRPLSYFRSSTNSSSYCILKKEREEPMTKRLSKIVKRSFKIKSTHDELGEVLAELLRTLDINELHIMTYKDRIDLFARKEMNPLHVELYEKLFSLSEDDIERVEEYKRKLGI